jgi:putative hydrolase of the HAD superfamily
LLDTWKKYKDTMMLDVIAFDADDTLWQNERLYNTTQDKFARLLAKYTHTNEIDAALYETEKGNIPYFGYGIKSFTLSMIETAIRLTGGQITSEDIAQIVGFAKVMIDTPVQLLEHAAETVTQLAGSHRLMIITKGDLLDQARKLERSGLAGYFTYVEIVSEKTEATYTGILAKYNLTPQRFLMVGNSLRSDVLPVVAIGGHAVYIPHDFTWVHEAITDHDPAGYVELEHIGRLPALVEELDRG